MRTGAASTKLTASQEREEEAMSQSTGAERGVSLAGAVKRFFTRWRERPQPQLHLYNACPEQIERSARELGISARDLKDLTARGPEAADLLYQRMTALGLSEADVKRIAPGILRDLERTCSCCGSKGICERE